MRKSVSATELADLGKCEALVRPLRSGALPSPSHDGGYKPSMSRRRKTKEQDRGDRLHREYELEVLRRRDAMRYAQKRRVATKKEGRKLISTFSVLLALLALAIAATYSALL